MKKFDEKLWNNLNEFRKSRDVRELQELIISLLFLKFADSKNTKNVTNQVTLTEESTWDYLLSKLEEEDFPKFIWKALYSVEDENLQLMGTFRLFDFENNYNKEHDLELIRGLFSAINSSEVDKNGISFSKMLGVLLSKFASYSGRRGQDYTTPDFILRLITKLVNPQQGSILDSTCGIGGFFQETVDVAPNAVMEFYGQEYNPITLAIAKIRFAFLDKGKIHFGQAENTLTLDQFPDLRADYVLMHPPFSSRSWMNKSENDPRFEFGLAQGNNADMAWLQHAIYHLNENGKAAILMTNSTLVSRGQQGSIRKKIIESDLIDAIIALPENLLTNTSIATCIWILNKNKTNKEEVLFVDASSYGEKVDQGFSYTLKSDAIDRIVSEYRIWSDELHNYTPTMEFSMSSSINGIATNDYILTPKRYLNFPEIERVDLEDAELLGNVLKPAKPGRIDTIVPNKEVYIRDLASSPDAYLLDVDILENREAKPTSKLLPSNVLLLSRVGTNIKPTYFTESDEPIAYTANNIFAFTVNTNRVDIEYLTAELYKEYVQKQLEVLRGGAGQPTIRRDDLLNVKVKIPKTKEKQLEIFKEEREMRFQSLAKEHGFEEEIKRLKAEQHQDLGSKKHNIMQHLNNVKAAADVLSKMMQRNEGVLKADEVISPRGVTVETRLVRLHESLDKVIYYVDNITNEVSFNDAEIINPIKLLEVFKERGIQKDNFKIEIIVDEQTFENKPPLIEIARDSFEEVYNNILENAVKHGFVDSDKLYLFRITVSLTAKDQIEIYFENNGKPFPKGISSRAHIKGEKAGTTGETGIGLWKVAEIAKHFGCSLTVFDDPDSEFPVGYKFQFNLKTL